jgi:Zn-dependent protease with chaperone function
MWRTIMAKWYYLVDGKQSGPIESAVLKQLATSGRLKPTDKVRREDMADWHRASEVKGLFAPSQFQTPSSSAASTVTEPPAAMSNMTPKLSADDYRMPRENLAFWIGVSIFVALVLLILPVFAVSSPVDILFFLAGTILVGALIVWISQSQLIGGCVAVSECQFPDLYRIAQKSANRLQMKQPEVYIKHSPEANAFATGFLGGKSVVLHSATVEAMDEDELAFIIGHEFSHIKCGHTNLIVLVNSVGRVPLLGIENIFRFIFFFHSRQAEYTCDRGGLLVCRNPAAAAAALCKLAVGPELYKRLDMDRFLEQQMDLDQNDIARLSESLSTHPYTVRRVRAVYKFHDSDLFKKLASLAV